VVLLKENPNPGETLKMRRMTGGLAILFTLLSLVGCAVPPDQSQQENQSPGVTVAGGWRLVLKVSVPDSAADTGLASNRLVAGVEETATEEFDNAWDVRALLIGPVQAYFSHAGDTGYGLDSQSLWQDIRVNNVPAEWVVEVDSENGRPVTVRWTTPQGEVSCDTNHFTLEDFDGSLGLTDLCATDSLNFTGDGVTRRLILKVS
jgi:hypothetical protein